MRLSTWLKENRITHQGFLTMAQDAGMEFSIHAINKWCNGQRIPRPEEMRAIHSLTKGAVQPNDFYGLTPANA